MGLLLFYKEKSGENTIDRDGNLLVEPENADAELLTSLLNEGLIRNAESTDVQPENAESAPEEEDQQDEVPLDLELSFPVSQHNGVTLRNLVNLLYSRGNLIGKATGGHFHVEEGLVDKLKDDTCTLATMNFISAVNGYEAEHGAALEGLKITTEKVIFTGFPTAPDHEHLTAFAQLAVLMNQQAISQKRIQAKNVNDENEKYALRTWLIRLGMNGSDFKATRKILMENLSGHAAFRTDEEAQKFLAREKAKRDSLKAAKQAAQEGGFPSGVTVASANAEPTQPDCETDTAQMLEAGA